MLGLDVEKVYDVRSSKKSKCTPLHVNISNTSGPILAGFVA
jgi:hypothetical protein